jgi:hypothetical protein
LLALEAVENAFVAHRSATAVSVSMVSLYRAFGSGWTIASSDSGIDKASIQ